MMLTDTTFLFVLSQTLLNSDDISCDIGALNVVRFAKS